jgi:hypothetical protein
MNPVDWLRRVLSPKNMNERMAKSLSKTDDEIREASRKRDEAFRASYVPPSDPAPQTQRILDFIRLPDMAKRRDAAVRTLADRMDAVLKPAGFARNKTQWKRALGQGEAQVALHRDRHGFICTIELRYSGPRRLIRAEGPGEARLGDFYRTGVESETDGGSVGWVDYPRIDADPTCLDLPLHILQDRALPWLLMHEDGHWPALPNTRNHG